MLLQAGRYSEAAREYRALLARSPHNTSYRLNLARALAWGERHREAEPLLRDLHREMPRDGEILSMLHSARANLEPSAADVVGWLGDEPDYTPYRVALARALAREQRPRLAIEQYERLLAMGPSADTTLPSVALLRRELVEAYVAAGERADGIRVVRTALAASSADTALRRDLAELLTADHQYGAAIAQYDTMLVATPTARLFTDRARLHLARNDRAAARGDLASSLRIAPSVDAYLMLGGLHRDAGDYKEAKRVYEAAKSLGGDSVPSSVAAALAQLSRDERPAVALVPTIGEDPGWTVGVDGAADNLGVQVMDAIARRAINAGQAVISLGAESAALREHSSFRSTSLVGGGASVGLASQFATGSVLVRVGGEAGVLAFGGVRAIPEASASAAIWQGAWEGSLSVAHSAGFRSTFTTTSLVPAAGDPLTEESVGGAIAGPLGAADVALSLQRSRFSDGNSRVTLQAYTRYALGSNLFAVYSGTSQQFAQRSTRYWDPLMYSAHAAGIELAERELYGWSYAVRFLPGIAASREIDRRATSLGVPDETFGDVIRRNALTLGASGDATYRSRAWELAGALSFGRGRAGDYQRLGATVTVRRVLGGSN